MRTKVTFLTGFAAGYVLGSRAGRARYEQIRAAASALAHNPAVQGTASQLQSQATDVLGSAKDKAKEKTTGRLGDTWQDKKPTWLGHGDTGTEGSPGSVSTATNDVAGSNGHVG